MYLRSYDLFVFLIASWVHLSGWALTCRHHQTKMEDADKRGNRERRRGGGGRKKSKKPWKTAERYVSMWSDTLFALSSSSLLLLLLPTPCTLSMLRIMNVNYVYGSYYPLNPHPPKKKQIPAAVSFTSPLVIVVMVTARPGSIPHFRLRSHLWFSILAWTESILIKEGKKKNGISQRDILCNVLWDIYDFLF